MNRTHTDGRAPRGDTTLKESDLRLLAAARKLVEQCQAPGKNAVAEAVRRIEALANPRAPRRSEGLPHGGLGAHHERMADVLQDGPEDIFTRRGGKPEAAPLRMVLDLDQGVVTELSASEPIEILVVDRPGRTRSARPEARYGGGEDLEDWNGKKACMDIHIPEILSGAIIDRMYDKLGIEEQKGNWRNHEAAVREAAGPLNNRPALRTPTKPGPRGPGRRMVLNLQDGQFASLWGCEASCEVLLLSAPDRRNGHMRHTGVYLEPELLTRSTIDRCFDHYDCAIEKRKEDLMGRVDQLREERKMAREKARDVKRAARDQIRAERRGSYRFVEEDDLGMRR